MAREKATADYETNISKDEAIAIAKKVLKIENDIPDDMELNIHFVSDEEAGDEGPSIAVSDDFEDNTGIVSLMSEKLPKKFTGSKNSYWSVTYQSKEHKKLGYPECNWGVPIIRIDSKTGEPVGPRYIN